VRSLWKTALTLALLVAMPFLVTFIILMSFLRPWEVSPLAQFLDLFRSKMATRGVIVPDVASNGHEAAGLPAGNIRHSPEAQSGSDEGRVPEPLVVTLGRYRLTVPPSSVVHVQHSGQTSTSKGYPEQLMITTYWPELAKLRVPQGSAAGLVGRDRDRITIFVTATANPPNAERETAHLEKALAQGDWREIDAEPRLHLTRYERSGPGWGARTFVPLDDYRTPTGARFWLACLGRPVDDHSVSARQEFRAPTETPTRCRARYQFNNGLVINYDYWDIHLVDWKPIDIAVRRLIDSFLGEKR